MNELVELHNKRNRTSLPLFRPETLLALILARCNTMWPVFAAEGFEPFMDRYLASWIHSCVLLLSFLPRPTSLTHPCVTH